MSRMQERVDVLAEINAWERIWALDETRLNLELSKAGLDPEGLTQRLESMLGLAARDADASAASASAAGVRAIRLPASPSRETPLVPRAAMPQAAPAVSFEAVGRMKFFNASRGFGFFEADGGLGDVLVHILHLRTAGYQTAYEGARVHATVHRTPRGLQVMRIIAMDESTAIHPSLLPQRMHEKVQAESGWLPATVKWYNRQRGYGFVCDRDGECMVHADTLQRWGVAPLWPKQAVEIRWGRSSKGRKVAEIRYPGGAIGLLAMH